MVGGLADARRATTHAVVAHALCRTGAQHKRRHDDDCHAQTSLQQVMKMDVEGFELAVLRGAQRLLARHNVWYIMLEANPTLIGGGAGQLRYLRCACGCEAACTLGRACSKAPGVGRPCQSAVCVRLLARVSTRPAPALPSVACAATLHARAASCRTPATRSASTASQVPSWTQRQYSRGRWLSTRCVLEAGGCLHACLQASEPTAKACHHQSAPLLSAHRPCAHTYTSHAVAHHAQVNLYCVRRDLRQAQLAVKAGVTLRAAAVPAG